MTNVITFPGGNPEDQGSEEPNATKIKDTQLTKRLAGVLSLLPAGTVVNKKATAERLVALRRTALNQMTQAIGSTIGRVTAPLGASFLKSYVDTVTQDPQAPAPAPASTPTLSLRRQISHILWNLGNGPHEN